MTASGYQQTGTHFFLATSYPDIGRDIPFFHSSFEEALAAAKLIQEKGHPVRILLRKVIHLEEEILRREKK